MLKKILFVGAIFLGITIFFTYKKFHQDGHIANKQSEWEGFTKTPHHVLPLKESIGPKAGLLTSGQDDISKRDPASFERSDHYHYRDGRLLVGMDTKKYAEGNKQSLTMKNFVHPEWKYLLSKHLLRGFSVETKVFIKNEKSLIEINNNEGTYLQTVLISYVRPNGTKTNFRAKVDPSNGKIMNTWDHPIEEKNPEKIQKFNPTGGI